MRSTSLTIIATSAILCIPLLNAAIPAERPSGPASGLQPLPDGPGKQIMERSCTGCHSLSVVASKRATPKEWNSVVQRMVAQGASGSDQDIETLVRYLAKNMGPGAPSYELPAAAASPAPVAAVPDISSGEAANGTPAPEPPSSIHVNVNRADDRALESILMLTPEEARALIAYRDENGPFRNWQEVGEIPGVPAGKIIQYQNRIVF